MAFNGSPEMLSQAVNRTAAMTKCTPGPAAITSARCHRGFEPYARGRSSGATGWYGFMPAIFT